MGNEDWDVSALLPRVTAHTLVVHNRHSRFLPVQAGQRLAARIPNARFQVIDDTNYEQLPGIIIGFLGESDRISQRLLERIPSGTAVDAAGLPLHLGLHAGDVIREDNNVYGGQAAPPRPVALMRMADHSSCAEPTYGAYDTDRGLAMHGKALESRRSTREPPCSP